MDCFFAGVTNVRRCSGEVTPGERTWLSSLSVVASDKGYCERHRKSGRRRAGTIGMRLEDMDQEFGPTQLVGATVEDSYAEESSP